jgi:hypothetical protein
MEPAPRKTDMGVNLTLNSMLSVKDVVLELVLLLPMASALELTISLFPLVMLKGWMFMFIKGKNMYIVSLEHIATGYPKQVQISLIDFLLFKLFPNYMCDGLEKEMNICLDYEYFYNGVKHVN